MAPVRRCHFLSLAKPVSKQLLIYMKPFAGEFYWTFQSRKFAGVFVKK